MLAEASKVRFISSAMGIISCKAWIRASSNKPIRSFCTRFRTFSNSAALRSNASFVLARSCCNCATKSSSSSATSSPKASLDSASSTFGAVFCSPLLLAFSSRFCWIASLLLASFLLASLLVCSFVWFISF